MNTIKKPIQPKKDDDSSAFMRILPVFLLAFVGVIFLRLGHEKEKMEKEDSAPPTSVTDKKFEERVNYHLSHAQTLKDIKEGRAIIDNARTAPSLREAKPEMVYEAEINQLSSDTPSGDNLLNDLNKRREHGYRDPITAEDRINQELIEYDRQIAEEAVGREQYIQQFIENARRDGFEVVVDSNGKVKSVRRIRPNSGNTIFDMSDGLGAK